MRGDGGTVPFLRITRGNFYCSHLVREAVEDTRHHDVLLPAVVQQIRCLSHLSSFQCTAGRLHVGQATRSSGPDSGLKTLQMCTCEAYKQRRKHAFLRVGYGFYCARRKLASR
jgi:hypothetical protein